ncbi:MAG: hypothetical protein HZB19_07480 [Chloroflexi bacterium]|nr:hypothetical protein [Chloroflexota bacterium]
MNTDDFLKVSFFKNIKTTLKRCWAPNGICHSKPIKAHSIQNSRVFEILSLNGHVIMPKEKIIHKGEDLIVDFVEIGRNEASTFTGLCGKHDKELFSPIDDFEIDVSNNQQLFLIAYRSVLKKFHSLALTARGTEKIYEDQVKVGRATRDLGDPSLNLMMNQYMLAWAAYRYKEIYDEAYLACQYDIVSHGKFSFKHKKPTVAISALYWLEIAKPNSTQVPWIALNVFPTQTETYVVFSYLVEDAEYVKSEIEGMLNASVKRRLWQLSERIIGLSITHKLGKGEVDYGESTKTGAI